MTELRVVVPDEVAERLTERARQRRTTPEQLAGEAVRSFVGPLETASGHRLSFIGIGRSGGQDSVAERHEETTREHFSDRVPKVPDEVLLSRGPAARGMTEIRVVVPDETAERGTSTEDLAAEVLTEHTAGKRRLRFIGIGHSGQPGAAARSIDHPRSRPVDAARPSLQVPLSP